MKLGLIGATGKMGKTIVSCLEENHDIKLAFALCSLQTDPSHLGPNYFHNIEQAPQADILIDFSTPQTLTSTLSFAMKNKIPLVLGTTGFTEKERDQIQSAALSIPLFFSPNFSLGLAAMVHLCQQIPTLLPHFSIEIEETHHIQKKDSPSGSALAIQNALNHKNSPIRSIRKADVIGKHSAFFQTPFEELLISHQVQSRKTFAQGALQAARFLLHSPPGLYEMKDLFTCKFFDVQ